MKKKKQLSERKSPERGQQASVFSYYQSRSGADSQRARYEPSVASRRGLDRLKHIPTIAAMVVILGCVLYASLLNSEPRVMISATESGKSLQRNDQEYADFISNQFQKSFFNKSKLTFNSGPMVESLRKQYPEVDNAIVTLPLLGHKPVVRIAVSSPAFILATQSGAYYINANGVPLVRVSDVKAQLQGISTVTDETNLPITVGTQVLPQDTVMFVSEVIQQLNATKISFDSVTLPLEANEVQVILSDRPYKIRFNTLEDARVQVGTFLAVEQRLQGTKESPKEYIDVRVAERAYYK